MIVTDEAAAHRDENKSVMLTLLEQQVRLLEAERDELCSERAKLMVEVSEYKDMADKLAIQIKDTDRNKNDDNAEQEDYIERIEEQLDHYEQHISAQD